MKIVVDKAYSRHKNEIFEALANFEQQGRKIGHGKRNVLKAISIDDEEVNIKAFKIPNAVNKIAYRFFRKSKAERSFIYAQKLLKCGIKTPTPIAYAEEVTPFAFLKSFYVSAQLDYDLSFRDLDVDKPGHERILRAFTHFTHQLHEKGIEFLDHSPGNTLIQIDGEQLEFYLVDLNRMNFKSLSYSERLQNFRRLSREKAIYEVMADEYAKITNRSSAEVFEQMWHYNRVFFEKRDKKTQLKKKIKRS